MARYIPENNLSYPVLIQFQDGSSGSGFFLNNKYKNFYLVTALHVLFQKDNQGNLFLRDKKAILTFYDNDLKNDNPGELEVNLTILNIKKDVTNDVVLVEMGNYTNDNPPKIEFKIGVLQKSENKVTIVTVLDNMLKKYDDVLTSNEVFILGYPNSLGIPGKNQIDYKRPLLRKGIIAGKNPLRKIIILDCPVYFGNSGGLAVEVEEKEGKRTFLIIGVVSEYIPFVERLKSLQIGYENSNFENSGYSVVIPTDTILKLLES